LVFCFHSTLDVRCSMLDVHLLIKKRAQKIRKIAHFVQPPRTLDPSNPRTLPLLVFHQIVRLETSTRFDGSHRSITAEKAGHHKLAFDRSRSPAKGYVCLRINNFLSQFLYHQKVTHFQPGFLPGIQIDGPTFDTGDSTTPVLAFKLRQHIDHGFGQCIPQGAVPQIGVVARLGA